MNKKLYVPDHMVGTLNKQRGRTSDIPKAINKAFPEAKENKNSKDPSKFEPSVIDRLPQPTGYRVLVIPWYLPEKTKGGLIVPDATRDRESFSTVCAYVVRLGPDAYKDVDKFPSGAWCSEKSWIIMGRYAGNRFKVDGLEVRIINDDNIIGTILDPSDISYV